ncbi:Rpn family recombination-promoting nuclease/putative transposase [Paenibacillus sp. GCM10027626]|uniref:Rpn family recombination-promoting nuclease/putative transposase n=1 Tax=Paenibacillus sp. GCM10027626 TaxID=3273411 RepID=UPI0036307072
MEFIELEDKKGSYQAVPHDEAFKKLLQTFFAEFIALFFPELDRLLDHTHTRLLMQELLVDVVGQESRSLDLLVETRYKSLDAFILVHIEPQSYRQRDFHERMFIYFSRLFEKYRKTYPLIIPIAIFSADDVREEQNILTMSIPEQDILFFHFYKVELRRQNWRSFITSDNPVAAALLAKMGYNKKEEREVRTAYLRMILRLQINLDDARLALIMSVADLYFEPDIERDQEILREISKENPQEGEKIMKLMPAWSRAGYEEGIKEGIEKGEENGKTMERKVIIQKFLGKGFSPEQLAETLEISVDEVMKLGKQ